VSGEETFELGHSEALEEPLSGYFEIISRHFEARQKLKATHAELGMCVSVYVRILRPCISVTCY